MASAGERERAQKKRQGIEGWLCLNGIGREKGMEER